MTTLVRDNHAELIDEAAAGHEQARDRITHAIAGLVSMDAVRGWPSRVASVAG
jgi:hypothetical protein